MTGSVEIGLTRRKVRDRSFTLVVAGTALLMPPFVGISLIDGTIAGVPVPIVYVSAVWAALIAAAAALASPLRSSETTNSAGEANDDAG